jgi:hypothetical protein
MNTDLPPPRSGGVISQIQDPNATAGGRDTNFLKERKKG